MASCIWLRPDALRRPPPVGPRYRPCRAGTFMRRGRITPSGLQSPHRTAATMPSEEPLQPMVSLGRLEPAKSAGSALRARELPPSLPPSADWRRYLVALRRYKWIVVAGSLLGGGAGFAAGRYLGSEYTARATIWIDVPDARMREEGPLWTGQLRISSGWTDLLETSAVLESVVRERRLYLSLDDPADSAALRSFRIKGQVRPGTFAFSVAELDPTFTLSSADGVHEQGSLGDSVGADLGFLWAPAPDRSEEHTSELQSPCNLVCRLLLEKKKKHTNQRQCIV